MLDSKSHLPDSCADASSGLGCGPMQSEEADWVLFLDFDGVLHPATPGSEPLCRLELLLPLFAEFPNAGIVISSSWRSVYPIGILREFLGTLQGNLLGITPKFQELVGSDIGIVNDARPGNPGSDTPRESECRAWIKRNSPLTPWVALDDQAELFSRASPNLILCDGRIGLTREIVEQVRSVIQQRPRIPQS